MPRSRFPWGRFYSLAYPIRFDELGRVLEEIWAAHGARRQTPEPSAELGGLIYCRLSVFPIEIPALRERPDDIEPLALEIVNKLRVRHGTGIRLTDAALAAFRSYAWPGNVRELANLIERLAVIRPNGLVDEADLPWPVGKAQACAAAGETEPCEPTSALPEQGVDLKKHLSVLERRAIEDALRKADGVVQRAADALGVGRTTLVEKIRRYGLG